MKRHTSERVQLRIDTLAAGGAGIGRTDDGSVIFVRDTAPGDRVEIDVIAAARPPKGKIVRLIHPSPHRVTPPCLFKDRCGGCDWMHLTVEAQQAAHLDILHRTLAQAGFHQLPATMLHPAPFALHYRNRARLFARSGQGVVQVGYRAFESHALVAVDECLVLAEPIAGLPAELPGILKGATGQGDILISCGTRNRPVVSIFWRGDLPSLTWKQLDDHVNRGLWAGVSVHLEGTSQPASFGDTRPVIQGADGLPLLLASGGFAQPSEHGGHLLAQRVCELAFLDLHKPPRLLELFAGSGTLTILLAKQTHASLVAVEQVPESVACLRSNLAERGLTAKTVVTDVDRYTIAARTDLVVLDPPRAGALSAMHAIAASAAHVVVYVSCNPATLARDLQQLANVGFEITHLEVVELFPQTSHIESIARLVRSRP